MDHLQEQETELETLSYIYPEELELISEKEFIIRVKMEDPDIELQDELLFSICIQFPFNYPQVIPEFTIESTYLEPEEIQACKDVVVEKLQESLGDAMVFTMVSYLKEEAENTIKERAKREEAERELEKLRIELEEQQKFEGLKVTPESFKEWKDAFLIESKAAKKNGTQTKAMEACLAVEVLLNPPKTGKPTGRQLFEDDTTLLESDEKYMDEGEDVEVVGVHFEEEEEVNQVLLGLGEDDD